MKGLGYGVACALSYAVTILIGRDLARDGLSGPTVLSIRFGVAAGLTALLLIALGRPLLPAPGERARALLFGLVGYAVESSLFFAGLERGSAAAVALLFYSYPAMVALVEVTIDADRRTARTAVTVGLCITGTVLVVASSGDVSITATGVAFALAAAASFSVYILLSHRLLQQTDSLTIAAWVAGGASVSLLARGLVAGDLDSPAGHWPELILNGLATASAFGFMFAALRQLGPGRTAIVMTLEAAFAVVLAGIFLDETVGPLQALGGVAILAATALAGLERRTPVEA